MFNDVSVTPAQLVIIRRLATAGNDNYSIDEKNQTELLEAGLLEEMSQGGYMLSSQALSLLVQSGLFPNKEESREQEVVKLYGEILKLKKVLKDIEKLDGKSNLTPEQKFEQSLGLIRNYEIVPTF